MIGGRATVVSTDSLLGTRVRGAVFSVFSVVPVTVVATSGGINAANATNFAGGVAAAETGATLGATGVVLSGARSVTLSTTGGDGGVTSACG